jgi:hypothetical protein
MLQQGWQMSEQVFVPVMAQVFGSIAPPQQLGTLYVRLFKVHVVVPPQVLTLPPTTQLAQSSAPSQWLVNSHRVKSDEMDRSPPPVRAATRSTSEDVVLSRLGSSGSDGSEKSRSRRVTPTTNIATSVAIAPHDVMCGKTRCISSSIQDEK